MICDPWFHIPRGVLEFIVTLHIHLSWMWIVIQKYFTSPKGLGFQHAHILGIYVCVCVYSNKKLIGNPKGMLPHICDSILINPLAKRSVLHTRGFESGTCWHKTNLMPNNTNDNWLRTLVYTYRFRRDAIHEYGEASHKFPCKTFHGKSMHIYVHEHRLHACIIFLTFLFKVIVFIYF